MAKRSVPKPIKRGRRPKGIKIYKFKFSFKDLILWGVLLLLTLMLFGAFSQPEDNLEEKPISEVIAQVQNEEVKQIDIRDNELTVTKTDESQYKSYKEPSTDLTTLIVENGGNLDSVVINPINTTGSELFWTFIGNLLPALLLIGFFIFMFRQARGSQESIFSFGRSGAKKYDKRMSKVRFSDVAGVDEAKEEMSEIVDFLKRPKKYLDVGARTPKGVLLVGPAGTGKTLLAKAVAGEAGVPFFSMAGSEFMEMLVGIGAKRVRDLFGNAKKQQPSIIFIDEVDAIGRRRSTGVMGSHDEREQTLNQILVEMDGFDPRTNVIVIAATNRGDLLDPALLRPGRFDRRVTLGLPDIEGRKEILKIHGRGKPFAKDVNWEKVARRTVGFSGADIENMLNEAAILAARTNKKEINMHDLEESATKVKLGPEKKRLQTDQDRRMTAIHEAGHAVVTYVTKHLDTVHRISIVSRGMALGYTLIPPERDRTHETKSHMLERIAMMMGGRAAEEIVFGEITSGAANDFDQATHIARLMVEEYGMSDIGPINFGPDGDITEYRFSDREPISQETRNRIDTEIQKILTTAYKQAVTILKKNRTKLDAVADELMKKETIDGDEFLAIMEGKKPKKANDEQ